jgi:hypothetical protein
MTAKCYSREKSTPAVTPKNGVNLLIVSEMFRNIQEKKCEFEFDTPQAHKGVRIFSSFTLNLHTHTALLGAPLAQ